MLSDAQEALLGQFRTYLEEIATGEGPEEPSATVDLYTLLGELTALKNEVRIESRQVKGALDHFRSLVEPLQTGNTALRGEITHLRDVQRQAVRESVRPLLLELLELRDRMAAALVFKSAPPVPFWQRFFMKEQQEIVQAWRVGQEMTLNRLDQLLASQEVVPMVVLGRPLDPRFARAVRLEHHPGVADGCVVAELRAGFLWQGLLLRPAEVVINKRGNHAPCTS